MLASPEPPSQHSAKRWTAQNLKIVAQFNTKLAQFFGTIFKSKFAIGGLGRCTCNSLSPRESRLKPFYSWSVQGDLGSCRPKLTNLRLFNNNNQMFLNCLKSQGISILQNAWFLKLSETFICIRVIDFDLRCVYYRYYLKVRWKFLYLVFRPGDHRFK